MNFSLEYTYRYKFLYDYYCKKYDEIVAPYILAEKSISFLSRANSICKWKDSFDKGIFYELNKIDDSTIHSKRIPKTKLSEQSQTKLGDGFKWGCFLGTFYSIAFIAAWYAICHFFDIDYDFQFMPYIAPFLLGAIILMGAILETYNYIARRRFIKRQLEFPYASLYIQHCSQKVQVKEILNIPEIDLELINLYYEAISNALKEQISKHKELLYNRLNEFCQSANYHNVVCKSIPTYHHGKRLPNRKELMPFSKIREHFDETKGFEVLMALLNLDSCKSSPACKYDEGFFDSAFFSTTFHKDNTAREKTYTIASVLIAIVISFICFKFPFVWHHQKPIAEKIFFDECLAKHRKACAIIDMDYNKKLQQPAYLIGVTARHRMLRNGGVGHDWYTYAEVNDAVIRYSEITIPIIVGENLRLYSEIIEEDPNNDDIGSKVANIPITMDLIESGLNTTLTIDVYEHHGRGAGESATWETNFNIRTINKLDQLPENYKPKKVPYPPKPSEDIKSNVSSWEVFKLTISNLL